MYEERGVRDAVVPDTRYWHAAGLDSLDGTGSRRDVHLFIEWRGGDQI